MAVLHLLPARPRGACRARPQVLNAYVDALGRGGAPAGARVEFWVPEAGALARLEADLPPHGSLGPLFYAFGLISAADLRSGAGTYATGAPRRPAAARSSGRRVSERKHAVEALHRGRRGLGPRAQRRCARTGHAQARRGPRARSGSAGRAGRPRRAPEGRQGRARAGRGDADFLAWLSATVVAAVRAAEQHEALKQAIRAELAAVESRYELVAVQVPNF